MGVKLLLASVLLLQDPTVEQLVQKLGSENIDERETATRKLAALGTQALPALEEAARSGDLELSRRAGEILKPIRARMAKERFDALEARIRKASSLKTRLRFRLEVRERDDVDQGDAEFLVKSPKMAFGDLKRTTGKETEHRALISDGKTLSSRRNEGHWNQRSAPAELGEKLATALARGGLVYWWLSTDAFVVRDPRVGYALSDFRPGESEGEVSSVLYRLTNTEANVTLEAKLWYEPKTAKLIKRTWEGELLGEHWKCTETYEEFALEPDLPDDKFRFPD